MQKTGLLLLGSLLLLGALALAMFRNDQARRGAPTAASGNAEASSGTAGQGGSSNTTSDEPLMLYCAASNRAVIEAIIAQYKQECGREVQVQFGPSQTLLTSLEVSGKGDLFLPADSSYVQMAKDKQLVAEVLPLAKMHAVVAVAKGNPKNIQSFDDLLKPDIKLVQANPEAAAIGKVVQAKLQSLGLWDKLNKATTAFRMTVNDAANDVALGAADASIVYDAVLHGNNKVESIQLKELDGASSDVCLAVAKSTRQAPNALHFARYVSAADRGLKLYAAGALSPKKAIHGATDPSFRSSPVLCCGQPSRRRSLPSNIAKAFMSTASITAAVSWSPRCKPVSIPMLTSLAIKSL